MATITGNNGVLKIADSTGAKQSVASLRNFSVDITSDTIETTTMGVDSRTYVKGLSSFSGSADVYFDPAFYPTSNTGNVSLNPTGGSSSAANILVGGSAVDFEAYTDSVNAAATKFSGKIIVTGFNIKSSMDGMVEASLSFQGSGPLSFATS
jgi:predicted secreted protein